MRPHVVVVVLVLSSLAAAAAPARGKGPATAPAADDSTPRGMLKRACSVWLEGEDKGFALFYTTNDQEVLLAKQMSASSVALARLEKLVRDRFGPETSEKMMHALGQPTEADLDTAGESITGNKAAVTFDKDTRIYLVRVGGRWRIDAAATLADFFAANPGRNMRDWIISNSGWVIYCRRMTAGIKTGKYSNAEQIIHAARAMTQPSAGQN